MNDSNKITFCINTANNEKAYLELLLQSILNGVNVDLHDILIFIDSDNQNTTQMVVEQKEVFPNLTIIKNTGSPVGYATNINYMFEIAKTDIVSYIQSDMIVGLNYDTAILSHLKDNEILSSTRVEPPLHSLVSNPVNYVENFGFTPSEFEYENFLKFSESIKNPIKITNYFFAPFSLYKHVWTDIGGHDVKFKKSREDSDIALRLCLNKIKLIQCWDALVYHFSCTSSRGIDWWKQENSEKELVRQQNDKIELDRFVQKWGMFIHPTSENDVIHYLQSNPTATDKIKVSNPPVDTSKFIYL
jgi:GT2 family glycosyltransferase